MQKADLTAVIGECKGKVRFCEEATSTLENALSEVQMQRDNARGQIEETFQTYRTMLETRKVINIAKFMILSNWIDLGSQVLQIVKFMILSNWIDLDSQVLQISVLSLMI